MKEVERVSLGGYAFTLNDDAARLTEEYLGQLEKHYDGRTGGGEIMDCIEERMAELLMEKAGRDGVVSHAMIEEVIGILGRPEDIEAGEEEAKEEQREATEPHSGPDPESRPKKKLYRDMTDKMVAGVCSGLAAYLNIEATLPRLIFAIGTVASLLGRWHHGFFVIRMSFPVLYVLLWICMPAAKTVRQRWEQRGEDGTLDSIKRNIERGIESGAREVDNALQSVGKSKAWTEIGGFIEKFIGVILLVVGFAGLFTGSLWGFGSGWFGRRHGHGILGLNRLYDQGMAELHHFAPNAAMALAQPGASILVMLVVFLPFLGLLYGALQLLFGFKSPKWHPGLVIFILWLMSVIATGILIATGFITTEFLSV
ncbi:MAG: PspC domain-containing protein [Bacteroidales bacterium]|nr:PspC domain-containing protein [Bacteroidales bacterium]